MTATSAASVADILLLPNGNWTNADWDRADAVWERSKKRASVTGVNPPPPFSSSSYSSSFPLTLTDEHTRDDESMERCNAQTQKCEIDFARFKGTHGLDTLLKELNLPERFYAACHPETPCETNYDWCLWNTHPAQAANCANEPHHRELIVSNRKTHWFNGGPAGRVTHVEHKPGRIVVDHGYNGPIIRGNIRCVALGYVELDPFDKTTGP
ncbi:hypothetical protein PLIIFM63780_000901 [Purpureocillium lilacinum]|nr:hypothetical protein PLIIFM63780_000901 [Purpureocillium lilacinum]